MRGMSEHRAAAHPTASSAPDAPPALAASSEADASPTTDASSALAASPATDASTATDGLRDAADAALDYVATVTRRAVFPGAAALDGLRAFDEELPAGPSDPAESLRLLHEHGSPATVASSGPDYYGFVTGGTHPAALGAAWLTSAWDQNAALPVMSPVAAHLHGVVRRWVVELLGLPVPTELAFVTGATMANATALAVARDTLLGRAGWDVQARGLLGAPELSVVVGAQAHSTLRKALGLVGLGRDRVHVVPADAEGRLRADLLPDLRGPVLLCAQAGEVNTGAFDPFEEIAEWAAARDAWVHVDGAFGLWALADPGRAEVVRGLDRADSWATDGHKWLNVTYDCGLVLVREPGALRRSFFTAADYLPGDPDGLVEAMHMTPQTSQRARVVEVWAVLRSLGRGIGIGASGGVIAEPGPGLVVGLLSRALSRFRQQRPEPFDRAGAPQRQFQPAAPDPPQHHRGQQSEESKSQTEKCERRHRGVVTAEQLDQQHCGAGEHADEPHPDHECRRQRGDQGRAHRIALQSPLDRHPSAQLTGAAHRPRQHHSVTTTRRHPADDRSQHSRHPDADDRPHDLR